MTHLYSYENIHCLRAKQTLNLFICNIFRNSLGKRFNDFSGNRCNSRIYHVIWTVIMNVHDYVSESILCTFIRLLCTISKVCFRCYGNASVYGRRLCALWSLSFHYLGHEYYVSKFLPVSSIVLSNDNIYSLKKDLL